MKTLLLFLSFFCVADLALCQTYLSFSAGASRSELGREVEDQSPLPGIAAAVSGGYRIGVIEPQVQFAYHRYGARLIFFQDQSVNLRSDYLNASAIFYLHLPTAGPEYAVAIGAGPQAAFNLNNTGETLSGWATGFFLRAPWFYLAGQYHQSLNSPAAARTNYYCMMIGVPIAL